MNVYISCHDHRIATDFAGMLAGAGHTIVSTWHTETAPRPDPNDGAEWGEKASRNMGQIGGADALVLIAAPDKVTGGKFVEAGYALCGGVTVYTVGRVENGMLWHPDVKHVANAAELIAALGEAK